MLIKLVGLLKQHCVDVMSKKRCELKPICDCEHCEAIRKQQRAAEKRWARKLRQQHQVKTYWYYIFWGIMSGAVVSGQLFVGIGYRMMVESIDSFTTSVAIKGE